MQRQIGDEAGQPSSGKTIAGHESPRSAVVAGRDALDPARDVLEAEGLAAEQVPAEHTVTAWLFRNGGEPEPVDLEHLPQLVAQDPNFVWVNLSSYSQADLQGLAPLLALPHMAVHAALLPWHRPRLDVFGTQFFVSVTVPRPDPEQYRVLASELDLFVGRNFLVSVHKLPLPFPDRVLARASHNPEIFELDSGYMLYVILDELLEYYEGLAEHLQGEVEIMEERALTDPSEAFLGDLLHFKRYAFALSQLAEQHRTVIEAFLRPDFPFTSHEDLRAYFRDLEARFSRLADTLFTAREAVNGAFDIYVSHMSHRTSQVMKVLTFATVLCLPASLVIAVFSTNMPGLPLQWPGGYGLMLACVLVTTLAVAIVFRTQRWM